MSVLREIIKYKADHLKAVKSLMPLTELKAVIGELDKTRPFGDEVKRSGSPRLKLIAELKKASPSKGLIREDFNPEKIISIYDKKGVAAISVLTEERYFQGSISYLKSARRATLKPLLRKDFIFDDYQIYEARAFGADAVLLIAAALEKPRLQDLMGLANELSLDCLVEVRDLKELDAALCCGAEIVGINNRDLTTLKIDLKTTFDLLKDIPPGKIVVSESGIETRADVEALEKTGVDAVLIGTVFMKAVDIGLKIDELMGLT